MSIGAGTRSPGGAIRVLGIGLLLLARGASASSAQTYQDIHDFEPLLPAPSAPYGRLVLGPDGKFYGVTFNGGDGTNCPGGCGTVFRMDTAGAVETVHEFAGGDDGEHPYGDLLLASDGNFYGVTAGDGSSTSVCVSHCGTVYRIETNGDFAVLHVFHTADGFGPADGLIEPQPGDLWGTTIVGGDPACIEDDSCGTVFRLHFDGGFETMHAFTFDESNQPKGPLALADNGSLYGITSRGGDNGLGTVFQIAQNGDLTKVHDFTLDCYGVTDGLVRVDGGDLVGACNGPGSGAVFRLSPGGNFQTVYPFAASGDEGFGVCRPMQASDGLLYGVNSLGGAHGGGTIYQLGLNGNFTKLHDFDESTGWQPGYGLTQSPDGTFYGVTFAGGANLVGAIYRLTQPSLARLFCPDSFVRRDQMAVFLLKTLNDPDTYVPPPCVGLFADVACPSLFSDWIEELANGGITAGCGGGDYCPLQPVRRDQMAVFLLKAEHGPAYTPPACTGQFPDVPCSSPFSPWVEQLAGEGITAGCGSGNFCPSLPVTRAQMAVFLLKVEHGGGYVPPDCQPRFADVPCPSLFAPWVGQLSKEHITAGCAGPP